MTKQEYMQKLQENLERFGQELQEDILEDYRQHFAEGEKQGKSEEEIIEELGNIEEMIRELAEEDVSGGSGQTRDGRNIFDRIKDVMPEVKVEVGKSLEGLEKGFKDFGKNFEGLGKNFEGFGKNFEGFGKNFEGYVSEQNFTHTGECGAIVLTGELADITIEPSEDDMIHVCYQNNGGAGRRYEVFEYEEDGAYHVGVKRRSNAEDEDEDRVKVKLFGQTVVSYGRVSKVCGAIKLNVKVPEGFPKLSATVSSGDVDVCDLHVVELQIQCGSGDVTVKGTEAGQMNINSTSGDIGIFGGRIGEGVILAASGDVDISRTEIESATISTASGDIELNDTKVFSARFGTGSGDISVQEGYIGSLICNTGSGDISAHSGVEAYVCGTGSGDISVRARKVPQKVTLNTGSGDIALNLGEAPGMNVTVESSQGDTDIRWKKEKRSEIKRGSFTYGDGSCKVYVKSGTGDISISAE